MHSRAPLIFAIVLLLLPVLYVGGYLALVNPRPDGANYASAWLRCKAGAGVLALFQWGNWILRPCPRAYFLTPAQPKQGSFHRPISRPASTVL